VRTPTGDSAARRMEPLPLPSRRPSPGAVAADGLAASEFTPVVGRLGCLRGISTLTGFALAVEIGDRDRVHRWGELGQPFADRGPGELVDDRRAPLPSSHWEKILMACP